MFFVILKKSVLRRMLKTAYEKGLDLGYDARDKEIAKAFAERHPRVEREVEEILRREQF